MANFRRVARRKARKYGINPTYFGRQINQESGYNPHARSPAGAQGIAQIMPGTAKSWGVNPNHPREALDAAARNMATYLRQFHGSWSKALTAYNAGPGAVGGALPAETQNYIHTILRGGPDHQASPGKPGSGGGGRTITQTNERVKLGLNNVTDQAAFKQARQGYVLGTLLAKDHGTQGPLFKSGLLSTSAPQAGDFTRQVLTSKTIRNQQKIKIPGSGGGKVGHGPGGVPQGARHLKGTANFEGHTVAAWIKPWLEYGRKHGWKGQVNSGYRSYADQVRIYNSGVRPAAKPGQSNHEGANFPRGAVDVSEAAQLSRILSRARAPLKYAGAKDPVHFSHPHNGSY